MRLLEVPPPALLPAFVASRAATLTDATHRDYRPAGRWCAGEAIRELTGIAGATIGTGANGEPLWPDGITGSITHKNGYVWAAAARRTDALSIGIDVECIIERTRAERLSRLVLRPEEHQVGGDMLDPGLRFTMIFSIKEAIFKCLFPLAGKRFYYEAFSVTRIDREAGSFTGHLTVDLAEGVRGGHTLTGRFATNGELVHTAVLLAPSVVTSVGSVSRPG
jgi:enterobactin synthetase component D